MAKNAMLTQAVVSSKGFSKRGLLERLFAQAFKGLVYPQIWEDPEVDIAALEIGPETRIMTIASGGCNVMNYLTESPARIEAIDLNPGHVALTRLKLAAARNLPGYEAFFRFFGYADEDANRKAYFKHLVQHLDPDTRKYWNKRGLRGRRINLFTRNLYKYGLLGRFIGILHFVAKLHGQDPRRILTARNMEEQRWLFDATLAPVFDSRFVRAVCRTPIALFGLGIPPAQYEALAGSPGGDDMAGLLRSRLERLACDFDIHENYFAWQAFGRGYDREDRKAVPRYLSEARYETIRANADRVTVNQASFTDYLREKPEASFDRYILLDAQDWMTDAQLNELWGEITRTAAPGARVIFRTAGEETILPGRLREDTLSRWRYDNERSKALGARDRSSIYGGFHLYHLASG